MKRKTRGFTLAELLIVVAIIAVLVAVSIPVFTKQLERSRESADFANMRNAYAEVMAAGIIDDPGSPLRMADGTFRAEIKLKQKQEDWQTDNVNTMRIGSVPYEDWDSKTPAIDGTATVTFYPKTGKAIIDWGGSGSGSGSIPVFHGTVNRSEYSTFGRGAVIQDDTWTCVIMSGMWETWTAYTDGATVAELTSRFGSDAVSVNTSDIKDSSSETLQAGDIYYDSGSNSFYYVNLVSVYEPRPNSSWITLMQ